MLKKVILILCCALLSSCATLFHHRSINNRWISLAPHQSVKLPSPSVLGFNKNVTQILTAQYRINDQTKTLSTQVEIEKQKNQLTMVAVAGWGGQIFSIMDNGREIKTSSLPMPNKSLGVKHVLADFMLTYLPTNELRKMLSATQVKLIDKPRMRQFRLKNKTIIKIKYQFNNPWRGKILIQNLSQHYTITIQNLNQS